MLPTQGALAMSNIDDTIETVNTEDEDLLGVQKARKPVTRLRVSVGLFGNKKAVEGRVKVLTWAGFLTAITKPRREGDKDGLAIIPAVFAGEAPPVGGSAEVRRRREDIAARSMVVLDCELDKGRAAHGIQPRHPPAVEDMIEKLNGTGWAYALYTSHSHAPEAPRYRVVLPLARPVAPGLMVVELLASVLDLEGAYDRGKGYPESLFYLPSMDKGSSVEHHAVTGDGEPVSAEWLEDEARTNAAGMIAAGTPPAIFDSSLAAQACAFVPGTKDRLVWLAYGFALHHHFCGSAEGKALWDEISRRGSPYDEEDQQRTWDSMNAGHKSPRTIRTIFKAAMENGWVPPAGGMSPLEFEPTEAGCREFMIHRHKDELRYDAADKLWYFWDRFVWRRDTTLLAESLAVTACHDMFIAHRVEASEDSKGFSPPIDNYKIAMSVLNASKASRELSAPHGGWNPDPWLLSTPGGTVDLRTGELGAASPGDMCNAATTITPAFGAACPRWLAFLRQATGDDDATIRFLQQWCGYCLTGIMSEQVFVFLYGETGSGKGTLITVLRGVWGGFHTTAQPAVFAAPKGAFEGHPTIIAELEGARLVTSEEIAKDHVFRQDFIKRFTGAGEINARRIGGNPHSFTPTGKIILVGNSKPDMTDDGGSMARRLIVVPFMNKADPVDPLLDASLREEYPAILAWMIEGCRDWQENGLTRSPTILGVTSDYLQASDLIGRWLDECCEAAPSEKLPERDAFNSYSDFCLEQGVKVVEVMGTTFRDALRFKKVAFSNNNGKRGYKDVRLVPFEAKDL